MHTTRWTRWWWLGSAVEEQHLREEMRDFDKAHIGGVEITSIYGIKGAENRHIDYLSPEWLRMLAVVCDEAGKLNMGVDLPLGAGWKCGGPKVPKEESTCHFGLDREGRIAISYGKQKVKRAAPGGEGYAIDVFDKAAVKNYFRYFNRALAASIPRGAIRCQFHDSFEYHCDWSREMFPEFRKRRGYDLSKHIEDLKTANSGSDDEKALRVRYDYRQTLEEMCTKMVVGRSPYRKSRLRARALA